MYRHLQDHLAATLIKAHEAKEVAQADTVLDQVKNLLDKAMSILGTAEAAGDLRTSLVGVREARGTVSNQQKWDTLGAERSGLDGGLVSSLRALL